MTPEERAEARRLVDAATPGPWEWRRPRDKDMSDIVWFEPFTDGSPGKGFTNDLITRDSGVYGPDIPTCEFIIASRTLVPQLLDALDAAERERDEHGSAYVMASGLLATEQVRSAEAIKDRDTARAQVETLVEALKWYAKDDAYREHAFKEDGVFKSVTPALKDAGAKARAALKAAGVET